MVDFVEVEEVVAESEDLTGDKKNHQLTEQDDQEEGEEPGRFLSPVHCCHASIDYKGELIGRRRGTAVNYS